MGQCGCEAAGLPGRTGPADDPSRAACPRPPRPRPGPSAQDVFPRDAHGPPPLRAGPPRFPLGPRAPSRRPRAGPRGWKSTASPEPRAARPVTGKCLQEVRGGLLEFWSISHRSSGRTARGSREPGGDSSQHRGPGGRAAAQFAPGREEAGRARPPLSSSHTAHGHAHGDGSSRIKQETGRCLPPTAPGQWKARPAAVMSHRPRGITQRARPGVEAGSLQTPHPSPFP